MILPDTYSEAYWNNALIGLALVNASGQFVAVNPMFGSLLGYTEAELLKKTFHEITHPEDVAFDVVMSNRILSGDINEYIMIKRYLTKTNNIVWMKLKVVRILDKVTGDFDLFFSQILPPIDILYRRDPDNLDALIPIKKHRGDFFKINLKWVIGFFGGIGILVTGALLLDDTLKHLGEIIVLGAVGGYQFSRDTKPINKEK